MLCVIIIIICYADGDRYIRDAVDWRENGRVERGEKKYFCFNQSTRPIVRVQIGVLIWTNAVATAAAGLRRRVRPWLSRIMKYLAGQVIEQTQ